MPAMSVAKYVRRALASGALALLLTSASVADKSALSYYDEAMDEGLYGEAEAIVKQALQDAIANGVYNDIATVSLLVRLARAQLRQGNHDAALQNYELAVDVVEENADRLDLALVGPLSGVADSYLAAARPDLALPYIERVLHVLHVNEGPHSIGQIASLALLTSAYERMGELDKALDTVERSYFVSQRQHGKQSTAIVPAMLEKGRLLGELGRRRDEREVYTRARQLIVAAGGDASPLLVDVQLRQGESYQDEYFATRLMAKDETELPDEQLLRSAEASFELAQAAAENLDAGKSFRALLDVHLSLGDFYTLRDAFGSARKHYQDALRLIATPGADSGLLAQEFDTMLPLLDVSPDLSVASGDDASEGGVPSRYDTGLVVVQFTITRRGRVGDIGLVEINPARNAAIETEVRAALQKMVFRPRYENGFAVDWPGRTLRYEYPIPRPSEADN